MESDRGQISKSHTSREVQICVLCNPEWSRQTGSSELLTDNQHGDLTKSANIKQDSWWLCDRLPDTTMIGQDRNVMKGLEHRH